MTKHFRSSRDILTNSTYLTLPAGDPLPQGAESGGLE